MKMIESFYSVNWLFKSKFASWIDWNNNLTFLPHIFEILTNITNAKMSLFVLTTQPIIMKIRIHVARDTEKDIEFLYRKSTVAEVKNSIDWENSHQGRQTRMQNVVPNKDFFHHFLVHKTPFTRWWI